MELVTDRLLLRELALTDATACNAYESDPEVVRYQSHGVRTPDESRDYIARVRAESDVTPRHLFDLAVIERATDALIGRVGLCVRDPEAREASLWYVLRRDRWGRGLIVEAARALLDFGFGALDLHRVYVDVDARNAGSLRVAEKLGMRREAHFVENAWVKGEWTDSVVFGLLAREWPVGVRRQRGTT
jgi:RimJ/RimL family protein N-acetyltransferase